MRMSKEKADACMYGILKNKWEERGKQNEA